MLVELQTMFNCKRPPGGTGRSLQFFRGWEIIVRSEIMRGCHHACLIPMRKVMPNGQSEAGAKEHMVETGPAGTGWSRLPLQIYTALRAFHFFRRAERNSGRFEEMVLAPSQVRHQSLHHASSCLSRTTGRCTLPETASPPPPPPAPP